MTRAVWLLSVLWMLACNDVTTNLVDGRAVKGDASTAPATGNAPPKAPRSDAGKPATKDAGASAKDGGLHQASLCGDRPCACDNGQDDDGDGLIDGLDPECTGPFDDDESSFATGAPAAAGDHCRDCFWDNNAGSGDDDCKYPSECLTGASPPGKGACSSCDVSKKCVDVCGARTPNGCDCFGCCELRRPDGSRVLVELRETCSLSKLDDAKACPRCTQSSSCRNDCGACELCPGRTAAELPAECSASVPDAGLAYTCDQGEQVCSPDAPCPVGMYCQLGCCLYAVQ
jgi:hypothetical protein